LTLIGIYKDWEEDKTLKISIATGIFSIIPDIDIIFRILETVLFTIQGNNISGEFSGKIRRYNTNYSNLI